MGTPLNADARERLRNAQRDEARALGAVTAAERQRDLVTARLASAQQAVDTALAELVQVSGDGRAALLTGIPIAMLRRLKRSERPEPLARTIKSVERCSV